MNTETTEPTEEILIAEQEKSQIAEIAKASILNIAKNKEAYEALRDEYTGITLPEFKDPEFKKIYKKVTEGSGKLVKARTAADKLVKSELALLDEVKTMIKSAGEDLKAITADTEKEIKGLKETAETLIEDDKQEQLRQIEEQKQARMVELLNLGFTAKPGYYELGDLNVTQMQLIQSTTAQWEGTIAQAKVVYEAEQLRIAEEKEAEEKRIADEKKAREEAEEAQRKAQELLTQQNEAKQKELEELNRERDIMRLQITEHRVDVLRAKGFEGDLKLGYLAYDSKKWGTYKRVDAKTIVDYKKTEWDELILSIDNWIIETQKEIKPAEPAILPSSDIKPVEPPKNGAAIKFTEEQRESILNDVLVAEESVKSDLPNVNHEVRLTFNDDKPFIDTLVGKSTFRIYPEQFLDAAQDGLTPEMVAASGSIGDELLFLVIKGK